MSSLLNVERAAEHNWLWPSIADAIDTYLRRRSRNVDGYERMWRLIHVWESIEVTLASVAVTRLRAVASCAETYQRARELLYGKSWNAIDNSFRVMQGALDGSVDRWIDILWLIKGTYSDSLFLSALSSFLDTEGIDLRPLTQRWALACDVPPDALRDGGRFRVREAMRHINSFRNRFAHVPFPYDPIDGIASALEEVTEQLFAVDPPPWKSGSVLTGALADQTRALRGVQHFGSGEQAGGNSAYVFPPMAPKGTAPEVCPAAPFTYIDKMFRPYVLTRLKDREHGAWEYTRFRAEANAVVTIDSEALLKELPEPHERDYESVEEDGLPSETPPIESIESPSIDSPNPSSTFARDAEFAEVGRGQWAADSFDEALQAIRDEDFDAAIPYLKRLVAERPNYHIGWLRLGSALREKAVRLPDEDAETRAQLLDESDVALTRALDHVDDRYKANALYERSKTRYRRNRLEGSEGWPGDPIRDATDATELSPDSRYVSWLEFLERAQSARW